MQKFYVLQYIHHFLITLYPLREFVLGEGCGIDDWVGLEVVGFYFDVNGYLRCGWCETPNSTTMMMMITWQDGYKCSSNALY